MSLRVFAVEDDAVQLVWRSLPPGGHRVRVGSVETTVVAGDGPGTVLVGGLAPGTGHDVFLDGEPAGRATTLAPLGGPERFRLALLGDLHVGEQDFGFLPRIRDHQARTADAHPLRCTRAALTEALAWGARLVVVKGDLAHHNRRREYDLVASLFDGLPVPLVVLPGNHDGGDHRRVSAWSALGAHGIAVTRGVDVLDLPGVRLVAVNTVRAGSSRGSLDRVRGSLVEAARSAAGPVLMVLHHPPHRTFLPTHLPPGLVGRDGWSFGRMVGAANPDTLVVTGHSHRHRRRRHGRVTIVETGSVKDYPGTWAGHVVHDGGIRQVVRRVADPVALAWTERTRATVGGAWGRWSPGRLSDRCFVHRWALPFGP